MADLPSTPADANVKVAWVPAIANPDAPTVAELTAGSVRDVSCYLTSDGWTPGLDEQTVADNRLCDNATFEQPGRSQRTLTTQYIDNTNTAKANVAVQTFIPGTAGYFVTRAGKAYDLPFIAGDKVDVWPVTAGQFSKVAPEANSVLRRAQKMFVTSRVRIDATVAA